MEYLNWLIENWEAVLSLVAIIGGPLAIWVNRGSRVVKELIYLIDDSQTDNEHFVIRAKTKGLKLAQKILKKKLGVG